MPLTPFSQNLGNRTGGGQAGFNPLTGQPNQSGFQMPPPQAGPFLSQQNQQLFAGGQMPQHQQEEQQGFEMPPPPAGPLMYQGGLGKMFQLDPNAGYTMGLGGNPKRAQIL